MKILSKLFSLGKKVRTKKWKMRQVELQAQQIKLDIRKNQLNNSWFKAQHATPTLEIVPTSSNMKVIGSNWLINFKNNQQSEHGEDGIIAKIFDILKPQNKWVCEFGAHDPENISNTWHLIHKKGWNAILIEADTYYYNKLQNYYQKSDKVFCLSEKISFEGQQKLDDILKNTIAPTDLDLMIIDIDGNDYHVWEAINIYQANVVIIEFNASIPTDVSFIQPRDLTVNQGSSLKAMVELAEQKGYKLIAVTSWNAFFVKNEYYNLFFQTQPSLHDMYVFPAKHPIWMRPFQLYDGSIIVAPWNEMLWHKIDLKPFDYQVLPSSLRSFSRQLAINNYFYETTGEKKSVEVSNQIYLEKIFQKPANTLANFAKNIYSRYGEDGILDYLTSSICGKNRYFVDVGAWDGLTYSKSRNLALNEDWSGLLFETDVAVGERLQKTYIDFAPRIKILRKFNSLKSSFKEHVLPKNFDLLILNTYGMEYHLFKNLRGFLPKIMAIQFNPTIPNDVKFIQADDAAIHQGCSLRALLDLAKTKNYCLVAVTLETAFFVHKKYLHCLNQTIDFEKVDLDHIFEPMQMHLFQLYDGTIAIGGLDRLLWHGLRIDEEMLQVVPKSLRKFHQFAEKDIKEFFYRV